jgi:hypothetical protein
VIGNSLPIWWKASDDYADVKLINPNNDEFSEALKTLEKAIGKDVHKHHPKDPNPQLARH